MNLNELFKKATCLNLEIKELLQESKFDRYDDLSGIEIGENTEESLIKSEIRNAFECLDDFRRIINYLNREVVEYGYLELNSSGRYQIGGSKTEFTCGSTIEFYHYDEVQERHKWSLSRLEATKGEYYIVGFRTLELCGLKVRVRRIPGLYDF